MSTYQPKGAAHEAKGGSVVAFSTSANSEFIKSNNASLIDNDTKNQGFLGTGDYLTGGTVDGITLGPGGRTILAVTEAGGVNVAAGDVVYVSAGDATGAYFVTEVSGANYITDVVYRACFADDTGTFTIPSGEIDPALTTEVYLPCQHGDAGRGTNEFRSYRSVVYTNGCWSAFCGDIDPCDFSGDTVTLWEDRRNEYAVTHVKANCVLTNSGNPGDGGVQA